MLLASSRPLSEVYDAALLDLDGVVYLGAAPVPAAPTAVGKARATGMATAFVTNNAARTPAAVADRLRAVDVPARPEDVVTSAQAGARLLGECVPEHTPVLVVGDTGLRLAVRQQGLRPVTSARCDPAAVIQGFSTRTTHDLLTEACLTLNADSGAEVHFVVTNGDATVPTGRGVGPGNGSLARVVANATGREPRVAGKPERPLHDLGVLRTGAERPLVVGDRLDTDILGAYRRGSDSMLVLSGVTSALDVVLAAPQLRPSYLAQDLGGINEPHPEPELDSSGVARCGHWSVWLESTAVGVRGEGNPVDGLRALCAVVWRAQPGLAPDAPQIALALAQFGFSGGSVGRRATARASTS
ncbi:HAD-IIA family hydrolase [Lipingzhangella sp. LS1_29]|uniref:HAD-IIA family hydrolase n=1 Tax=Lipingzhangella rawalii TaxID=2055835 RepID=A0ABU2H028_9ACTN|nr:HAD-IIA family hydrolase [Lipingzhangella rawalii]MDS1268673.1 HAD-IIA family hydrolase [Lipingzhangella rawalii]